MNEKIKRRNPVALSPLLRKGGAHVQSATSVRQNQRVALQQSLEDWREELEFEQSLRDPDSDKSH